jgi:hypothetical protein
MPFLAVDTRAISGICLGNLVEFYDFAVFGGSAATLSLVLTRGQGAQRRGLLGGFYLASGARRHGKTLA